MIHVEHLTKHYGPVAAIQDVTFTVERGEIVGFLGPNGAGKTTTLRILTGFIPATSGKAMVAGYDIFQDPLAVRQRIGYLPETVPLYGELKVKSYLAFVAEVKGLRGPKQRLRVGEVMERCQIADVANQLIGTLSRGYRQRVGLAQALLNDPEVLILDEPTVGLDPKQIVEMRRLIKELAGERTVLLSTHILPEVHQICQRVIIINQGRIVAMDTPQHLAEQLQASARLLLKVNGPEELVQAALQKVDGVLRVTPQSAQDQAGSYLVEAEKGRDLRGELARTVVEEGFTLLELRPADLTLEDIFVKLVTEEQTASLS